MLRSGWSEEAARADGRELLGGSERLGAALGGLPWPARLLTAPAGLFGQPPGMHPPELCATWLPQAPMLTGGDVPGCNHYTIVLDPAARDAATGGRPDHPENRPVRRLKPSCPLPPGKLDIAWGSPASGQQPGGTSNGGPGCRETAVGGRC